MIRRDRGEIWWATAYRGLHVAKFEAGTWPFKGSNACSKTYDYFADQYDPQYAACPAARAAAADAKRAALTASVPSRPAAPSSGRSLAQTGLPSALTLGPLIAVLLAAAVRFIRLRH